jgi:hypothetical protein
MPTVSVLEQIHCVQGLLALQTRHVEAPLLLTWEIQALEAVLETLARAYYSDRERHRSPGRGAEGRHLAACAPRATAVA